MVTSVDSFKDIFGGYIELSEPVASDMDALLQAMPEEQIVLRDLGITGITVQEIFDSLRAIFTLS